MSKSRDSNEKFVTELSFRETPGDEGSKAAHLYRTLLGVYKNEPQPRMTAHPSSSYKEVEMRATE